MGDIIIEETNHRAFAMSLANFFMLVASLAICIYGIMKGNKLYMIGGLLAAVVFCVGFVIAIMQALKEKKLLIITMDGINDCSSIGGFGFISYSEIKDFEIIQHYNTETIAIILKNRKEFLSKLAHPYWKLAKSNLSLKQPAIQIHTELAKDMEPEDIMTLLQKRLRDYNRLYN